MTYSFPKVGQLVRATRDILLTNNNHIELLTSPQSGVLKKGTEAEITAVDTTHVTVNCKDGFGNGPAAWGLIIKVAKVIWGSSFS